MTLEQLEKRRDSYTQAIKDATAEKDSIEKQIDSIMTSQVKRSLQKYKLSMADLLKVLNANGDQLKKIFDQLGKEEKETKNV